MSATSKPHILIIGAGISGLCFALQILTHANKFYTVTVFEKARGHPPLSPSSHR